MMALGPDAELLGRLWWRMRPGGSPDVRRRLDWIRRAEEGELAGIPRQGYAQQPYTQLMAVYRGEGRDGDARRVGYERELRRRPELRLPGQAWNVFLWTVGYGYRPWLAFVWLGVLWLLGALAFSSLHDDGDIRPLRAEHPPFSAPIYTLDRLIPVVSFGLRDAFAASGGAQWLAFGFTLLGWALTVALLAGLNAAVRRD
jgi:hypothetical protein